MTGQPRFTIGIETGEGGEVWQNGRRLGPDEQIDPSLPWYLLPSPHDLDEPAPVQNWDGWASIGAVDKTQDQP